MDIDVRLEQFLNASSPILVTPSGIDIAVRLEQVLKDHDLPVKRFPKQRFSLPLTAWREGSF